MQKRKTQSEFRKVLPIVFVFLLLTFMVPVGAAIRQLVIIGLGLALFSFVCSLVIRQFRGKGIAAIGLVAASILGLVGWAFWSDEPNRQLIEQINSLKGFHAHGSGEFIVGKVKDVYIGYEASEVDLIRFTQLEGIQELSSLTIDGVKMTDDAIKAIMRLKSLQFLSIRHFMINDQLVLELHEALPGCHFFLNQ